MTPSVIGQPCTTCACVPPAKPPSQFHNFADFQYFMQIDDLVWIKNLQKTTFDHPCRLPDPADRLELTGLEDLPDQQTTQKFEFGTFCRSFVRCELKKLNICVASRPHSYPARHQARQCPDPTVHYRNILRSPCGPIGNILRTSKEYQDCKHPPEKILRTSL